MKKVEEFQETQKLIDEYKELGNKIPELENKIEANKAETDRRASRIREDMEKAWEDVEFNINKEELAKESENQIKQIQEDMLKENTNLENQISNIKDSRKFFRTDAHFKTITMEIEEIKKEISKEELDLKKLGIELQEFYSDEEKRKENPLKWQEIYKEIDDIKNNLKELNAKVEEYSKFKEELNSINLTQEEYKKMFEMEKERIEREEKTTKPEQTTPEQTNPEQTNSEQTNPEQQKIVEKNEQLDEKDPVLEKYQSEGFHKNAFGWYFNPGESEYDRNYDPHNDPQYNISLKDKTVETKQNDEAVKETRESTTTDERNSAETNKSVVAERGRSIETDETPVTSRISEKERNIDVNEIKIIPIENVLKLYSDKEEKKFSGLSYNDDRKRNVIDILKSAMPDIKNKKWKSIEKAIDPHIIEAIKETYGDDKTIQNQIERYLDVLLKGDDSGIKIEYDLRDIYKSDLSLKQIKNLERTAKAAQRRNPELVNVDKDSFFKSVFGNLRKIFKPQKLVGSGKETKSLGKDTSVESSKDEAKEKFIKDKATKQVDKLYTKGYPEGLTKDDMVELISESIRKNFDANFTYDEKNKAFKKIENGDGSKLRNPRAEDLLVDGHGNTFVKKVKVDEGKAVEKANVKAKEAEKSTREEVK